MPKNKYLYSYEPGQQLIYRVSADQLQTMLCPPFASSADFKKWIEFQVLPSTAAQTTFGPKYALRAALEANGAHALSVKIFGDKPPTKTYLLTVVKSTRMFYFKVYCRTSGTPADELWGHTVYRWYHNYSDNRAATSKVVFSSPSIGPIIEYIYDNAAAHNCDAEHTSKLTKSMMRLL